MNERAAKLVERVFNHPVEHSAKMHENLRRGFFMYTFVILDQMWQKEKQ